MNTSKSTPPATPCAPAEPVVEPTPPSPDAGAQSKATGDEINPSPPNPH